MSRRLLAGVAFGALVLALSGCFNPFWPLEGVKRGVSDPPPIPNTPRGIIDLFAWCWNNRAYDEYTEIFTDDFEFQFNQADSAGNAFRDRALFRQDELETAKHLFIEGTGNEPPASRITLQFPDRTFVPQQDSRPGKMFPWHQEIKRSVVLSIDTGEQQYRITGSAIYFVVRGDSAKIPDELVQRGFRPDVNRWYIERWEDETVQADAIVAGIGENEYRAALGRALSQDAAAAPAAGTEATGGATAPAAATSVGAAPMPNAATTVGPLDVSWGYLKAVFLTGR